MLLNWMAYTFKRYTERQRTQSSCPRGRCQAIVCLLSLTLSALCNDYLNPHSALSALCICLTDLWAHGIWDVLFCPKPGIDNLCFPCSLPTLACPICFQSSSCRSLMWDQRGPLWLGTHNAGHSGAVSMYFRAVYCLNKSKQHLIKIFSCHTTGL